MVNPYSYNLVLAKMFAYLQESFKIFKEKISFIRFYL